MKLLFNTALAVIFAVNAIAAENIDFGNSFFNKDRYNSVSKIIKVTNSTDSDQEYSISFTSHKSMQTSDIKISPLTEEIVDEELKETFSSITPDSCVQNYGEVIFNLAARQSCRLLITFVPSEAKKYSETMIIRSDSDKKEYTVSGRGIMMPDFTILYYTDNSGENLDNKRAEYSIKWNNETAGLKSDKFAFIKISKNPKDNDTSLTFSLEGDSSFYIDKLTTCNIKNNTITVPQTNSCGIVIGFTPASAGDFIGKIAFGKRIISGAKEYILSGQASDILDFGTVHYGGNVQKILIANSSDRDQSYSILSETKESNFRISAVNNKNVRSCISSQSDTGFILKKGESCYIGFTFAPDKNEEFVKKFIIMSNTGERREVTLKGTGVEKLKD